MNTSLHTDKINIQRLVKALYILGCEYVVISPGSRSAPIVQEFYSYTSFQKTVIFDERSAGFYALGIAQQTKKPTILLCTSGTALLNYAPAICEAFYQKISLIILSADRPLELRGKGENQTINQENIFNNFIKSSFNIDSLENISDVVMKTIEEPKGPVHLNIPLTEPLYNTTSYEMPNEKLIGNITSSKSLSKTEKEVIKLKWKEKNRKVIICGRSDFQLSKLKYLLELTNLSDTLILSEPIANTTDNRIIQNTDGFCKMIADDKNFDPDLVVTIGEQILSKQLRKVLKTKTNCEHWHLSLSYENWDIFGLLSNVISMTDVDFLKLISKSQKKQSNWQALWLSKSQVLQQITENHESNTWSDFSIFRWLSNQIPDNSIIQWGNSSVIRYASIFKYNKNIKHFANRGTSGIDGCLSTAVGCATANSDKVVYAVVGDLSFFYDSNALFIKPFPKNLRIILINNAGGNIFRLINGQKDEEILSEYFEARHQFDASHFAKMFDLDYELVDDFQKLSQISSFILETDPKPYILELKTEPTENYSVYHSYFKKLNHE